MKKSALLSRLRSGRITLFFLLTTSLLPAADKPNEMDQYRHIVEKPVATVQDLVDLVMMTRGDFIKHASAAQRIAEARLEGWLKKQAATDLLDRGTLAYAIIQSYPVHRGWLFRVTNWNRYALRDVQEAGILSSRNTEGHHVSGEQLVGAINAAEDYRQEKDQWSQNH